MQPAENNSLRNTASLAQDPATGGNNTVQNDEVDVQGTDINNHWFRGEYQSCMCSDGCLVCLGNPADSGCAVDQLAKSLVSNQELPVNVARKEISARPHPPTRATVRRRKHISLEDKQVLEAEYQRNSKPSKGSYLGILQQVSMSEKQVQIWLQNRRQRDRQSKTTTGFGFPEQAKPAEVATVGPPPWPHGTTNAPHSDDVVAGGLPTGAWVAPTLVPHQPDGLFYQRKSREIGDPLWQPGRQSAAEHGCHPHETGYDRLLNSHFRAATVAVLADQEVTPLADQEAPTSVHQQTVAHPGVDSIPLNPGTAATAADGNAVGGGDGISDNVHSHISTGSVLQVMKEPDIQYVVIHRQRIILRLSDLYLNGTQICQAARLDKSKRGKYTKELKKRCITQKVKNSLWVPFKHGVFLAQALNLDGQLGNLFAGKVLFKRQDNYLL